VEAGYVAEMDTRAVGVSIIELGGGRRRVEDGIDSQLGIRKSPARVSWWIATGAGDRSRAHAR